MPFPKNLCLSSQGVGIQSLILLLYPLNNIKSRRSSQDIEARNYSLNKDDLNSLSKLNQKIIEGLKNKKVN